MKFSSAKPQFSPSSCEKAEQGYILLVLLLFITVLAIGAAAIAPSIAFEVKRDREEEMIHRGVQYSRAVRHYFKQFNRYPTKIEDLENTNNIRFLRKRYKDPITGADFKVVHLGEAQMAMAGAAVAGLGPAGNPASATQSAQPGSGLGGGTSSVSPNGATTQSAPDSNNPDGSSSSSTSSESAFGSSSGTQPGGAKSSTDTLAGQTFGGGPIAGVVSTSKAASIREFNKKNHYNEWLFIYDPQTDRGGLLSTPSQPPLMGAPPVSPAGGTGTSGSVFGNQGMGNQATGNSASPFGGGTQSTPQSTQPQPPPQQ